MSGRSSKTQPVWSWLVFAGFAALYLVTAAHTVQGGDSGEFATVAAGGGVPHPSGYPLFALLSQAFVALIPFGSVAWKVSALSALLGAAALGVLHRALLLATRDDFGALVGSAMLGFSPLFWRWSVVQEVLSGACLTAALVLLVAVRAATGHHGRKQGLFLGLAFATGIAHHHTAILLAPLLLYALVASVRRPRTLSGALPVVGLATLGALVGLLPYLAFLGDGGAWRWGETDSLSGLVHHFLRMDYGTLSTGQADRGIPLLAQPLLYLGGVIRQFPGLLAPLVLLPSSDAFSAGFAKFSIESYKVMMTADKPELIGLELRGRVSMYGGDKMDFRWVVPDANMWLPILNNCTSGRLSGEVDLGRNTGGREIEGEGPLASLQCRVILK